MTIEPLAPDTLLVTKDYRALGELQQYISGHLFAACERLHPNVDFPFTKAVPVVTAPSTVNIQQPRAVSQSDWALVQSGAVQNEDLWATLTAPGGDVDKLVAYLSDRPHLSFGEIADTLLHKGIPAMDGQPAIKAPPQIRKAIFSRFAVQSEIGGLARGSPGYTKAYVANFVNQHRNYGEQILRSIMPARHFSEGSNLAKIVEGFLFAKVGTFKKHLHLLVGYDAIGPIDVKSWNDVRAFVVNFSLFFQHYCREDFDDGHVELLLNGAAGSVRALQNMSPSTVDGPRYAVMMFIHSIASFLDARLPWATGNSPVEPMLAMFLSFPGMPGFSDADMGVLLTGAPDMLATIMTIRNLYTWNLNGNDAAIRGFFREDRSLPISLTGLSRRDRRRQDGGSNGDDADRPARHGRDVRRDDRREDRRDARGGTNNGRRDRQDRRQDHQPRGRSRGRSPERPGRSRGPSPERETRGRSRGRTGSPEASLKRGRSRSKSVAPQGKQPLSREECSRHFKVARSEGWVDEDGVLICKMTLAGHVLHDVDGQCPNEKCKEVHDMEVTSDMIDVAKSKIYLDREASEFKA